MTLDRTWIERAVYFFNLLNFLFMNKLSLFIPFVLLLILSGCFKSNDFLEIPDDPLMENYKKAIEKPFNANLSFEIGMPDGESCDAPQSEATNVRLGFDYSGNATHMGAITGSFSHCIDNIFPPAYAYNGIGLWIAANGAEVYFEYDLSIYIDFNTFQSTVTGPYTITGGTGRFANASGSGTITGTQDLTSANFAGTVNASGTIVY
jgi:hypothetical protein